MTAATAVKPLTLIERLSNLRRDQDIRQHHLAATIGVAPNSVRNWEHGTSTPNIINVIAYAHAVGHRIVVTRRGQEIGDLADMLPRLADLRQRHHLTRPIVAHRMQAGIGAVAAIERHTAAGIGVRLPTLERYLNALGYHINLAPAERAA